MKIEDHYNKETQEITLRIQFNIFDPSQVLPECESLVEAKLNEEGVTEAIRTLWAMAVIPKLREYQGDILKRVRDLEKLLGERDV